MIFTGASRPRSTNPRSVRGSGAGDRRERRGCCDRVGGSRHALPASAVRSPPRRSGRAGASIDTSRGRGGDASPHAPRDPHRFESGDADWPRRVLERLVETSAPGPRRAEALADLARVHHFEGTRRRAVELLRQALDECGDDLRLRAVIEERLTSTLIVLREDLGDASAHARAAVVQAERLGDPRILARTSPRTASSAVSSATTTRSRPSSAPRRSKSTPATSSTPSARRSTSPWF